MDGACAKELLEGLPIVAKEHVEELGVGIHSVGEGRVDLDENVAEGNGALL